MSSEEARCLYDLARGKRWDEAMARVMTEECREELRWKDKDGRLPLHRSCERGAPLELVEALVKGYPGSVRVTDNVYGRLPLHMACWGDEFSPRVVRLLLNAYPEGAKVIDDSGDLPLHLAATNHAPLEVYRLLLDAHPEGAATGDQNGDFPVHRLVLKLEFHNEEDAVDKVEVLLRRLLDNEEARLVPNPWSRATPLHIAAKFDVLRLHTYVELPRCPPDVIMMVAKRHPGQLQECDDDGNLPLHRVAANPNLNGVRDEGKDLIGELVKLYPGAAAAEDGEGRFPLVLAIESGKKWKEGVEALVDAAEHIITVRDAVTGLYAFMLAATADDPCIDAVYNLWRRCPEPKRYILD